MLKPNDLTPIGRIVVTVILTLIAFIIFCFTGCSHLRNQERTYKVSGGIFAAEVNLKPAKGYEK